MNPTNPVGFAQTISKPLEHDNEEEQEMDASDILCARRVNDKMVYRSLTELTAELYEKAVREADFINGDIPEMLEHHRAFIVWSGMELPSPERVDVKLIEQIMMVSFLVFTEWLAENEPGLFERLTGWTAMGA